MRSNRDAVGVDHRIGIVDPVHLGAFEDDVGLDFHRPQRGRRVGAEVRIAGAGAEDHDPAFLEVADGAPADERLGDRAHLDRGDDAGDDVLLLERVLERQRVDDRRQHPHVVGGGAVHPACAGRHPRKMLPPPMTIAVSTPIAWISATSLAICVATAGSMP